MENNTAVMPDDCIPQEMVLKNVKLAQAYVPFQFLCSTFSPESSLMKGTIFPPLWDNYRRGMERMVYEDE